jgi:hypothetical protein
VAFVVGVYSGAGPPNRPAKNDVGLRLLGPAFDPLSGPGAAQEAPGHTPGTAAKSMDVPGPPVWARGRARSVRRPPGHVYLLDLKRGPVRYAKHRPPAGTQVKKMIGPAWTGRSRPPAGYFTKRLAEDWLRDKVDELRFAGSHAPDRFPADCRLAPLNSDPAPQPVRIRATVADAAAEYLRVSFGRSRFQAVDEPQLLQHHYRSSAPGVRRHRARGHRPGRDRMVAIRHVGRPRTARARPRIHQRGCRDAKGYTLGGCVRLRTAIAVPADCVSFEGGCGWLR